MTKTHSTTKALAAVLLASTVLGVGAASAVAEERTLRAGTFLPQRGVWHEPFQNFVDGVNEKGKGLIQIEILVDPAAMSPFKMGEALANGVVDMLNISGAFYTNLVPESDANKLFNVPIAELRTNGAVDLINEIHRDKMNAHFLTRWGEGIPYHIYVNKALSTPSLDGFSMRGTPLYRPYLEALGANIVQMTGSEIYPAMEAGVVDGYAWPLWGVGDLGLLEVTDYRLDPGFYSAEISLLINADVWDSLSDEQRAFLDAEVLAFETRFVEIQDTITETQKAIQEEAGIEVVTFSEEENLRLRKLADDKGWETVIANAPETGPQLKALTYREPE